MNIKKKKQNDFFLYIKQTLFKNCKYMVIGTDLKYCCLMQMLPALHRAYTSNLVVTNNVIELYILKLSALFN